MVIVMFVVSMVIVVFVVSMVIIMFVIVMFVVSMVIVMFVVSMVIVVFVVSMVIVVFVITMVTVMFVVSMVIVMFSMMVVFPMRSFVLRNKVGILNGLLQELEYFFHGHVAFDKYMQGFYVNVEMTNTFSIMEHLGECFGTAITNILHFEFVFSKSHDDMIISNAFLSTW